MRTIAILFTFLFISTGLLAQDNYRSIGSGNWNATNVWEKDAAGNGTYATTTSAPTSSNSLSIRIQSGHTVTVTATTDADSLTVLSGGALSINSGQTLTIQNGAGVDLRVTGTLNNAGTLALAASSVSRVNGSLINSGSITGASATSLFFEAGGLYDHKFTTTAGTIPTSSWSVTSTMQISGYTTNTTIPAGINQIFGNFTWNTPNLNLGGDYFRLAGQPSQIAGTFTIISTGASDGLNLNSGGGKSTITYGGDLIISNTGNTYVSLSENTGDTTYLFARGLTVNGNTTYFDLGDGAPGQINLTGNLDLSGGSTVDHGGANAISGIFFKGASVHTYTGGASSNVYAVHFIVDTNAILSIPNSNYLSGTGQLTVRTGGVIQLGSSSASGAYQGGNTAGSNIRTTGTRTINAGGSLMYNGAATQYVGNGLTTTTGTPGIIINNTNGVFLNQSTVIPGRLTLTAGHLNLNSYALTIGNSTSNIGALTLGAGHVRGAGTIVRWFNTTNVTLGSDSGLFPYENGANDDRFIWIGGTPANGGTMTVIYNSATGTTNYGSPFTDGGITVDHRTNFYWAVATGNGLTGSNFQMKVRAKNLPQVTNVANMRIGGQTGIAPGNAVNGSGTVTEPEASRVSLTASNLNNQFYMASNSTNPMPVEMSLLSATATSKVVDLKWITYSEVNNNGFEIERSRDGQNFEKINFVNGAGNSTQLIHYSIQDADATAFSDKTLYYRLRQVDMDGAFAYSNIATVTMGKIQSGVVVSPNPVKGSMDVSIRGIDAGEALSQIFDMRGNLVHQSKFMVNEGSALIPVDATTLYPGIYVVNVTVGNLSVNTKFIKE